MRYSSRPKVGFLLSRHNNNETMLQEISSTPFNEEPGNTIGTVCTFRVDTPFRLPSQTFHLTVSVSPRRPGSELCQR